MILPFDAEQPGKSHPASAVYFHDDMAVSNISHTCVRCIRGSFNYPHNSAVTMVLLFTYERKERFGFSAQIMELSVNLDFQVQQRELALAKESFPHLSLI
jgi:hypothetical protein